MIRISALRHRYGGVTVLDIAAWQVPQGEHWLIAGQSGCGKSTLLSILALLLKASEGNVEILGRNINTLAANEQDQFRRRSISIVLQRLHLIPAINVQDNLRLTQTMARLPVDEKRIRDVLDMLGLSKKLTAMPSELSVGEAQRVAIGRAVLNRPKILLADEPTSALDDENAVAVIDLLKSQATDCGATLLIATHDGRVKAHFKHCLDLAKQSIKQ